MLQQEDFLSKFRITPEEFATTKLSWDHLTAIHKHYATFRINLNEPAQMIANILMQSGKIHSVRYRVKEAEHVIEKIIRKTLEKPDLQITIDNYTIELTDLIGLRALHLFKDGWEPINTFILDNWNIKEKPVANIRKGDAEMIAKFYQQKGCIVKEHKYGYRSVHYLISTQPVKQEYIAEIQVRTIFEEAWAEIDHTIRYPYDMNNQLFSEFLLILNRLAGSADEMGTYIQLLKTNLQVQQEKYAADMQAKDDIIAKMEKQISQLGKEVEGKEELMKQIHELKSQKPTTYPLFTSSVVDSLARLSDTIQLSKFNAGIDLSGLNTIMTATKGITFPDLTSIKTNTSGE